ncbi:MAG: ABC transporter substrate-binding protein, partial [Bacillota bacterium]|nr:ABC transporter substrate-binding protein [Bacillota bacterium]
EVFLEAYEKIHGKNSTPEDGVALGYDAYMIALDAIEKAGEDATGEEVREILAGQNQFRGASGNITFNNVGDPIKTAYISTWRNGKVESLYTIQPNL